MFYFPAIIYMSSTKTPTFINSTLHLLLYILHEKESVKVKESVHQDSISIQPNHTHILPN